MMAEVREEQRQEIENERKFCHGKYGPAPLSGVTDPYSRSLYIGCFLPTNLQLMDERQKHSTFATSSQLERRVAEVKRRGRPRRETTISGRDDLTHFREEVARSEYDFKTMQ
jgi:hypothetical protein